jgi:hypothetical protein
VVSPPAFACQATVKLVATASTSSMMRLFDGSLLKQVGLLGLLAAACALRLVLGRIARAGLGLRLSSRCCGSTGAPSAGPDGFVVFMTPERCAGSVFASCLYPPGRTDRSIAGLQDVLIFWPLKTRVRNQFVYDHPGADCNPARS